MKLVVGLGNIGENYNGTRHNLGFTALDIIATHHTAIWQQKDKFKAILAEISLNSEKLLLAKPTTFYNLSGEAAQAIKDFYKINNSDILVIHDELALPFGTIRVRNQGSDAGNNGIKSLIAHIGNDFTRVRVGIANPHLNDASDFVLSKFSHEEHQNMPQITDEISRLIQNFVQNKKIEHTSIKISEES